MKKLLLPLLIITIGGTCQAQSAALSATAAVTQPTCNAGTGYIVVTVSGGVPPYSVAFANQVQASKISTQTVFTSSVTIGIQTTLAQPISITVTDSAGTVYKLTATLNQPQTTLFLLDAVVFDASCPGANNGVISFIGSGIPTSEIPTSYSVTNIATGVTLTQQGANNSVFANLPAGQYILQATNSTTGDCGVGLAYVLQPKLAATASVNNSAGTVTITVIPETPSTAPYTVTLNGVTKSGAGLSFTFSGLTTGTYNYTVTDANFCTITGCVRGPSTNPIAAYITDKYCPSGCVTPTT